MLDRKEHLPPTTGAKPNFLGLGAAKVPIFIVGAPRSGTTLMQCMLSANEATYSLPETHFFCTILPELAIPPSSPVTSDQLDDINAGLQRKMAFRWPDNLLTALLHKAEVGNIRAFEVFDALLECFRPEEGSTELRPVEKTPFHVFYLGQILEIYPHARFVHLIRDPRDVVGSRMSMPNAIDPSPKIYATDWVRVLEAAFNFGQAHPGAILSVRYEDLVANPRTHLQRICAFLNLAYQPSMLENFADEFEICTLPSEIIWKGKTQESEIKDTSGSWRTRLQPEDIIIVEQSTNDWAGRLGYRSSFDTVEKPVVEKNHRTSNQKWREPMNKNNLEVPPTPLATPEVSAPFASPTGNHNTSSESILLASQEKLAPFHNKHLGQRCVIIGNGPSLNKMDLSFLKDEICFGMNRIYLGFEKWDFLPTYYVSVNPLVLEQSIDEILNIPAPKFISHHGIPYFEDPDQAIFLKSLDKPIFSRDPSQGLWEGYTVTYVALQLAFYMGFSHVILIGVDHHFIAPGNPNQEVVSEGQDQNHFDPEYFGAGTRWHLPDLKNSEMAYKLARYVYANSGRSVIDATYEGKLQVFPKVDYRQIWGSRHSNTPDEALFVPDTFDFPGSIEDSYAPPLVSILLSIKEAQDKFEASLESILDQTYPNIELIIVNEGTLDALPQIEAICFEQPFTYVEVDENQQPGARRNAGLAKANGVYIAYLDEGWRYKPDHISILQIFLETNNEFSAAYTEAAGYSSQPPGGSGSTEQNQIRPPMAFNKDNLLISNYIPTACLMHHRSCIDNCGEFDEELPMLSDWDFLIRLAMENDLAYVPGETTELYGSENLSTSIEITEEIISAYQTIYQRYAPYTSADIREKQALFITALAGITPPELAQAANWPEKVLVMVQEADQSVGSGDFVAAKHKLAQALDLYPDDPWLIVAQGNVHLNLGDSEAARHLFVKAAAFYPDYIDAHVGLGVAFLSLGQFTDAEAALQTAHRLNPQNEGIETLIAEIQVQQNGPSAPSPSGPLGDQTQIKTLQENWDAFGKQDPMWSILTRPDKKGNNWQPGEFFETGIKSISALCRELNNLNIDFPTRKALDFGCGIGRLTQALAMKFDEVDGVDIAPSMIAEANKYNRFGRRCRYQLNRVR